MTSQPAALAKYLSSAWEVGRVVTSKKLNTMVFDAQLLGSAGTHYWNVQTLHSLKKTYLWDCHVKSLLWLQKVHQGTLKSMGQPNNWNQRESSYIKLLIQLIKHHRNILKPSRTFSNSIKNSTVGLLDAFQIAWIVQARQMEQSTWTCHAATLCSKKLRLCIAISCLNIRCKYLEFSCCHLEFIVISPLVFLSYSFAS